MVKRYSPYIECCGDDRDYWIDMRQESSGGWVDASDYDALAARLAEADTLIRRYVEAATAGIIQSSAKNGTWNVEQDMRAYLKATASSADPRETVAL